MALVGMDGRPIGKAAQKAADTPERQIAQIIRKIESTRTAGKEALVDLFMTLWRDNWVIQYDPTIQDAKVTLTVIHHFRREKDGTEMLMERVVRCGKLYIEAIQAVVDMIPKVEEKAESE